jgi:ubiquinone/menaquinone biosynthesis C-methylase UbiE
MDPPTSPEENIRQYYDNFWSVGRQKSHQYLTYGFHFGYFEKGIIKHEEAIRNMNDFIGRLLCLETGQPLKIFDAGCGVGATSRYLSKKYPQSHFTGISLGSHEIELAKKIQKEQNIKNAVFLVGNYTETGFLDSTYDGAFALESFAYATSKKDVACEISRVLKPGGKLVIIDGFLTKDLPLNSFMQNAYMVDLKKRALPGYASLREMRTYLESAGFTDIIIRDISKNIFWNYLFSGFIYNMFPLFSSEIKRAISWRKRKKDEASDKIMKGADFVELLLGITKKTGYYALTATKK